MLTDVRQAVMELRRLADKLPMHAWDTRPTFAPGKSSAEIDALEGALGAQLPEDARIFLSECAVVTALDVHNGYELRLVMVTTDTNSSPEAIRHVQVGTDGGGNAFLMDLGRENNTVSKWHHETGELTPVAESFLDFLRRIVGDWQAYVSGRPNHSYLAG